MDSPKLLLILIVVSFSMAAPQINQRQVVGDVISQLEPAILEAVASLNLGFSSSSFPSRSSSMVSTPGFTATSPSSPLPRSPPAPPQWYQHLDSLHLLHLLSLLDLDLSLDPEDPIETLSPPLPPPL